MTPLNVLITSSVVALGVLLNSASPANALVAQGGGGHLNARTPNHNGVMKRKRSSHKNRKRCVQQQPLAASSSSDTDSAASAPSSTDQSAPANTPAPPSNYQANPAQTCGNGAKVGLAWGPSMPADYILNAITASTCWYYNWSAWAADSAVTGSLKFVPMLWGVDKINDFSSQVINTGTNYGIALAMNELVLLLSASGSSSRY
jgi:Glycosyl hydrolase catalytic core